MKCFIIVTLFSNIKTIDFDIFQTENGQTLKISYEWPRSSFMVSEMFKRDGCADIFVNKMHPKFLSTEKALETVRENFEVSPIGVLEIKLPTLVQLEPSTWKKTFNKKADGTLIVFFEFLCHRDEYIISKAIKSISFA